jgi:hypothetical protein
VPVAGVAAGLWASLTGLAITVVLTLVVWIFAAGESASDTAMRVGADIWLIAHGTPFVVGTGVWSLLPWAWVVFPGLTLWGAGRWLAHRSAIAYPKSAVVAAACLGGAYGLVALLAALFGTLSGAGALPVRAVLHAGTLAFLVSGAAIVWRARLASDVLQRAWRLTRPAVGALAALTIGACLVLAAALVTGHSALASSLSAIDPGLVGGVALFVAWLGYLPAALMWCLSFAVGTGVTVGQTTVTPLSPLAERIDLVGVQLLPTTTQGWWLVGVVAPIAAGVVLTRLCPPARTVRQWLLPRAAAVAIVLIAVDLWWAISVGRLGDGRLDVVGPPPMVIAVLMAGVVLGVLGDLGGTWIWRRWRKRGVIDLTDDPAQTEETDDSAPADETDDHERAEEAEQPADPPRTEGSADSGQAEDTDGIPA